MAEVLWEANGVLPFGIKNFFAHHVLERWKIYTTYGVLTKKTISLDLKRISGIEMRQSILGRICKYGTINLITWGRNVPDIKITVKDPDFVLRKITDAKERVNRSHSQKRDRYQPHYHN